MMKAESEGTIVKYPAGELVWVRYLDKWGKLRFVITSKLSREKYNLYELVDGKLVKKGSAKEPNELVEKNNVYEQVRE